MYQPGHFSDSRKSPIGKYKLGYCCWILFDIKTNVFPTFLAHLKASLQVDSIELPESEYYIGFYFYKTSPFLSQNIQMSSSSSLTFHIHIFTKAHTEDYVLMLVYLTNQQLFSGMGRPLCRLIISLRKTSKSINSSQKQKQPQKLLSHNGIWVAGH